MFVLNESQKFPAGGYYLRESASDSVCVESNSLVVYEYSESLYEFVSQSSLSSVRLETVYVNGVLRAIAVND